MKTNTPRTKEKAVRVQEIQRAARKVFFEKGFQKASVDEIAKIAKISKGTVYLYFANKGDLYLSLMLPMFREVTRLLEGFEEKLNSGQFTGSYDFFMAFSNIMLEAYKYDPDGFKVFRAFQLADFFSDVSTTTLEGLNDIARENNTIAQRIMNTAIELGLLPKHDIIKVMDISWGLFLGVMYVEIDKLRWTQKDHIEDTLKYAFTIISNGIQDIKAW